MSLRAIFSYTCQKKEEGCVWCPEEDFRFYLKIYILNAEEEFEERERILNLNF